MNIGEITGLSRARKFVESFFDTQEPLHRALYSICLKDDEVVTKEIFYTDFDDLLRQQLEFEATIPEDKFIDIGWP